ncbi:hypothetical protein UES1_111 [Escherichia phage UE-S1]|nr:hypothetical protein UES1_111 [Escherichia phage UE-S1]
MMFTQERLNEIEQELLKIQHELQAVVRPVNSDNNVLSKYAQIKLLVMHIILVYGYKYLKVIWSVSSVGRTLHFIMKNLQVQIQN